MTHNIYAECRNCGHRIQKDAGNRYTTWKHFRANIEEYYEGMKFMATCSGCKLEAVFDIVAISPQPESEETDNG